MFGIFERPAFVNVLHVLSGDPVRRRDLAESFDSCVFFAEDGELFNKAFSFAQIDICFFDGGGNFPINFSKNFEEAEICKAKSFEDEPVNSGGVTVFVKFEGNNDLLATESDFAGFVIDTGIGQKFRVLQNGREVALLSPSRRLFGQNKSEKWLSLPEIACIYHSFNSFASMTRTSL